MSDPDVEVPEIGGDRLDRKLGPVDVGTVYANGRGFDDEAPVVGNPARDG